MIDRFTARNRIWRPAWSFLPLWPAALVLLGGCATYHARPLSDQAVRTALAAPDFAAVKIAASKLAHPLLPPQVIDGRGGFTPDEVALMAVIVSPQLRAWRDQRGVARAQVLQAGILPNPQFGFTTDIPHGNADPTLVSARSLGLSWDVTALLLRHDKLEAAKASAKALDLDLAWREWQVAQQARLLAWRVLSFEERLPLARSVESEALDTRALMERALEHGQMKSTDLAAANAALTTARNDRLGLEQDLVAARIALNVLLGQPAGEPLRLKAEPGGGYSPVAPISAEQLMAGLEARRLDLVALKLGYESQEAALRAAIMAQFPKIGLSLSRARDTSDVKTHGFGVTIDVPLFDRNQGEIARARATRQQLFDEYVARLAETRAEVAQLVSAWSVAGRQLRAAEADLPGLETVGRAMARQLSEHTTDILSYRDAQRALLSQRLECARLRQNRIEIGVALSIATGRPSLTPQPSPSTP